MTVVFCENFEQYTCYCRENNIPRNSRNYKFASDPWSFHGLQGFDLVIYGTPYRRTDYEEMRDMLEYRSRYYNGGLRVTKLIEDPVTRGFVPFIEDEKTNKRPVWY